MIAIAGNFDVALDGLLASRTEPAVPPDLARRIVVRTVRLPQFASIVPAPARPRPDRSANPSRGMRHYWFGGALAASLAAVTIAGVAPRLASLDDVSLPRDGSGSVPAIAGKGSSVAVDLAANVPAPSPQSSPAAMRSFEAPASGRNSREVVHEDVPAQTADGGPRDPTGTLRAANGAAAAISSTKAEFARAEAAAHASRPEAGTFILAASPSPPERVYGPVLDSDTVQYNASPTAGVAAGMETGLALVGAAGGIPGDGPR